MTDELDGNGGERSPTTPSAVAAWSPVIAAVGLAVVGGVVLSQIFADPVGGVAGAVGAGVVAGLLWRGFVVEAPAGVVGRAALIGGLAMVVACLVARFTPWSVAATVPPNVLLFSLWMVLPIGVAAAVGLALVLGRCRG